MKGMNFEEWKALVQKRREGMTHSEIHNHESQLGPMSKNDPEYGQTYTITYNVTGNVDTTGWPTEIKSARTLKLNIPVPYGATSTVDANALFTYDNGVLTIQDVQQDIEIAINITDVLYENAKLGDYLYSDWTFGPTEKAGYLGRCVGLATENEGKSVWCSPKSSSAMKWSTKNVDTGLDNFTSSDTAETDFNGKSNTEILLSLGTDKYLAAAYASELFLGNGYLPGAGELYKYRDQIKMYIYSGGIWSSAEYSSLFAWMVSTYGPGGVGYDTKSASYYVVAFCQLSGKPGKPINTNGHEYVDLGLPSGTKWATMNVGASSETDYGLYFQWGDTQGYTAEQVGNGEGLKAFAWADYKWTEDGGSTMSKYNTTDGKTVLDLEDDAVAANWGGDWKMPTDAQFQELLDTSNCTNKWTTVNGVKGRLFTSVKNGNTLFIPGAGFADNGSMRSVGGYGEVYGSSFYSSNIKVKYGRALCFNGYYASVDDSYRSEGNTVRGVIS